MEKEMGRRRTRKQHGHKNLTAACEMKTYQMLWTTNDLKILNPLERSKVGKPGFFHPIGLVNMIKEMKERGWGRSMWRGVEGKRSEKGVRKKKGRREEGGWGGKCELEGDTEGKKRGRNRGREEKTNKIKVSKTKSLMHQQPSWEKGTSCLGHETN